MDPSLSSTLSLISRQVADGDAHPAYLSEPDALASMFTTMGLTLSPATLSALQERHEQWASLEWPIHDSLVTLQVARRTAGETSQAAAETRRDIAILRPGAWLPAFLILLWAVAAHRFGGLLWWSGLALGAFWMSPVLLLEASYLHVAFVRRMNAALYCNEKHRLAVFRAEAAEARQLYAKALEQIAQLWPDRARTPATSSCEAGG